MEEGGTDYNGLSDDIHVYMGRNSNWSVGTFVTGDEKCDIDWTVAGAPSNVSLNGNDKGEVTIHFNYHGVNR